MEKAKDNSEKPLISIIVPVYNVQPYLCECLDSILRQTYKNIQVVTVDDGSTDGSGDILDEYAKKDSRITLIRQKNSGIAAARNAGLDASKGEYIGFVDSDDSISLDMYEYLYGLISSTNASIAMCNYSGGISSLPPIDKEGLGGLIVSVNLETGICETLGITEKMEKFEYHPDTKIKIQGFQIPHWESALKLSEELAKVVPQQRFASWDLALTKNGWVMIEGNSKGGLLAPQLTTQKGVRDIVERTFYKYI